jgi:hypothetical protein
MAMSPRSISRGGSEQGYQFAPLRAGPSRIGGHLDEAEAGGVRRHRGERESDRDEEIAGVREGGWQCFRSLFARSGAGTA